MDLKNELVWSHSRDRLFRRCLRAYWFCYYGAWGGWERDAQPEVRATYEQKKLTSIPMWIGTRVHRAAESTLRQLSQGCFPDEDELVRSTHIQALADIEDSRSGRWRLQPSRRVGFREHYYQEPVLEADWAEAVAEIERQVHGLFAHRIFQRLMQVPERIVEFEQLSRFYVDDDEVYVSPDVLVEDSQGGMVIVDWKTGEGHDPADIAAQLGIYGLYVQHSYGAPRLTALHVDLRLGTHTLHPVGADALDHARARIHTAMAEMRGRLDDITENKASLDAHPPLPADSPTCLTCMFRRACGRETPTPAP